MTNTLYYFFSTSAQSVAALVGILGAFLIFQLQNLIEKRDEKIRNICIQFIPYSIETITFGFLLDNDAKKQFRKAVSYPERILILWDKIFPLFGELDRVRSFFNKAYSKKTDEAIAEKIEEFLDWKLEFEDLKKIEMKVAGFKRSSTTSFGFGLLIIFSSLFFISIAEHLKDWEYVVWLLVIFLFIIFLYLIHLLNWIFKIFK